MTIKETLKKLFKGKYKTEIRCSNCNRTLVVFIEKGVTILQYKQNGKCSHCGCKYEDYLKEINNPIEEKK